MVGKSRKSLGSLLAGLNQDVPVWMPQLPKNRNVFETARRPCNIVVDLYEFQFVAIEDAIVQYTDATENIKDLLASGHSLSSTLIEETILASVSKLKATLNEIDSYNRFSDLNLLTSLYTIGLDSLWDKEITATDLQDGYSWCRDRLLKVLSDIQIAIHYERSNRELDQARRAIIRGEQTTTASPAFVPLPLTLVRPAPGVLSGSVANLPPSTTPSPSVSRSSLTKSAGLDQALMPPPPLPAAAATTLSSPFSAPAPPPQASGKRKQSIPTTLAPQSASSGTSAQGQEISDMLASLSMKRPRLSSSGITSSASSSSNNLASTPSAATASSPLPKKSVSLSSKPIAALFPDPRSPQSLGCSTSLISAPSKASTSPPTATVTTASAAMPPPPLPLKKSRPKQNAMSSKLATFPLNPPLTPKIAAPATLRASIPTSMGIATPGNHAVLATSTPTPCLAQLSGKRKRSTSASSEIEGANKTIGSQVAPLADDTSQIPAKRRKIIPAGDTTRSLTSTNTASAPTSGPTAPQLSRPALPKDDSPTNSSASATALPAAHSAAPIPRCAGSGHPTTASSPVPDKIAKKSAPPTSESFAEPSAPPTIPAYVETPNGSLTHSPKGALREQKPAFSPASVQFAIDPDIIMVDVWLLDLCDYFRSLTLEYDRGGSGLYKNNPFRFNGLTKSAGITKRSKQCERTTLQKDRLLSYAKSI